jgi:hypothetical protein
MLMSNIPEALTWATKPHNLDGAYVAYMEFLSESLGRTLARIVQENVGGGEALVEELRDLGDVSFTRLLTAPETSYRLLWPARHSTSEISQFLRRSVLAERCRTDTTATVNEIVWTPVGDMRFSPDGEVFSSPVVKGLMPLDFDSPYALNADLSTMNKADISRREAFNDVEKDVVLERLTNARDGIVKTSGSLLDFVVALTKVLVLQKAPAGPPKIFTRSPERYLGLSVFTNPHLSNVDDVDIAEGLVHEAIHSLMDMDEVTCRMSKSREQHWYYNDTLYDGASRTTSPWTGSALALPTYFQATFVWYGLLHFWCMALEAGAFLRSRVKGRIVQAASGFLGRPLLDQVGNYTSEISPELLAAVERMQEHVKSSFA